MTPAAFQTQGARSADTPAGVRGGGLIEPVSPGQEALLNRYLEPGEETRARLLTDIGPEGNFARRWLLLTDRRLLVVDEDRAEACLSLPLDQITSARTRDFVGSGILEVVAGEQGYDVVRYTRGVAPSVSAVAQMLRGGGEQATALESPAQPIGAQRQPPSGAPAGSLHRCQRCGRALPARTEVCPHCLSRRKLLLRLFGRVRPYAGWALLGFCLTVGITGLHLAPPYLSKELVDRVIIGKNLPLLWVILGFLVASYALAALFSAVRTYLMEWLGQRVMYDLRTETYDHLQQLSLGYYNKRQTGQIMSRITSDVARLQYFIAEGLQDIVMNFLTMIFIAAILLRMHPFLALLTLIPTPIIGVGTYTFGRRIRRLYRRVWRRYARIHAMLGDSIPGVRVVKSFAQEDRESRRFKRRNLDAVEAELQASRMFASFFPVIGFITSLGSLIVWGYGGYVLASGGGGLTLGTLVAFTQYMWRFYMPVQQLGRMNHQLQHAATSAERVFEILDTAPEIQDEPGAKPMPRIQGRVEFDHVTFSYDAGKPVIQDLTFTVEPGEMVGLVGPSGAGKSTLVHLLCRFYDVQSGAIRIDGYDLRQVKHKSLREQIGVVLQEPFLFHGTIASNIAYGNPRATPDEIIAAAKAANAHEFIVNFPDAYDTQAGERGVMLSGGERQRISIARAILRDPRILILDEATSSVDTETEMLIQEAIERLVQDRTTFAIAHRLSTLRKADRLIVLDKGKLVEMGTHDELVDSGGLYSRLCRLQSELSKMRAW